MKKQIVFPKYRKYFELLGQNIKLASDDELGRKLQDMELLR